MAPPAQAPPLGYGGRVRIIDPNSGYRGLYATVISRHTSVQIGTPHWYTYVVKIHNRPGNTEIFNHLQLEQA